MDSLPHAETRAMREEHRQPAFLAVWGFVLIVKNLFSNSPTYVILNLL